MINVRCRIASLGAEGIGYELVSSSETNRMLRGYYDLCENMPPRKAPFNEVIFSFDYELSSVVNLHNCIMHAFGIKPTIPETKEEDLVRWWPELIIEIKPRFLIKFEDETLSLKYVVKRFNINEINAFLVFVPGRGELFRKKGFRFYIPSHEGNRHNRPHVHVETSDHRKGSVDIITLRQLKGGKIREYEMSKIKKILVGKQEDLLKAWNLKSDGIEVDANILLEQAVIKGK